MVKKGFSEAAETELSNNCDNNFVIIIYLLILHVLHVQMLCTTQNDTISLQQICHDFRKSIVKQVLTL